MTVVPIWTTELTATATATATAVQVPSCRYAVSRYAVLSSDVSLACGPGCRRKLTVRSHRYGQNFPQR